MFRLLPEDNLWDHVRTAEPVHRRTVFYRLFCLHEETTAFTRIDHRWSTPDIADVFEGYVCVDCGTIVSEEQVF